LFKFIFFFTKKVSWDEAFVKQCIVQQCSVETKACCTTDYITPIIFRGENHLFYRKPEVESTMEVQHNHDIYDYNHGDTDASLSKVVSSTEKLTRFPRLSAYHSKEISERACEVSTTIKEKAFSQSPPVIKRTTQDSRTCVFHDPMGNMSTSTMCTSIRHSGCCTISSESFISDIPYWERSNCQRASLYSAFHCAQDEWNSSTVSCKKSSESEVVHTTKATAVQLSASRDETTRPSVRDEINTTWINNTTGSTGYIARDYTRILGTCDKQYDATLFRVGSWLWQDENGRTKNGSQTVVNYERINRYMRLQGKSVEKPLAFKVALRSKKPSACSKSQLTWPLHAPTIPQMKWELIWNAYHCNRIGQKKEALRYLWDEHMFAPVCSGEQPTNVRTPKSHILPAHVEQLLINQQAAVCPFKHDHVVGYVFLVAEAHKHRIRLVHDVLTTNVLVPSSGNPGFSSLACLLKICEQKRKFYLVI
jgi:hypothetical protein